jgi:hypothetical protein
VALNKGDLRTTNIVRICASGCLLIPVKIVPVVDLRDGAACRPATVARRPVGRARSITGTRGGSASGGGLFGLVGNLSIASATLAAWIVLLRLWPRTVAMVALPLVLSFLTIDKIFRLHDHIPGWPVFYLPLLAATFVVIAAVARRLSPWRLRAGSSSL